MRSDQESKEFKELVLGHSLSDMREIGWQQTFLGEQTFLRVSKPPAQILEALSTRFALDELHIKDICNHAHPPQFTRLDNGSLHIILRFPVERASKNDGQEVTSVSILADGRMCALIWPGERFHYFSDRELSGLTVEDCVCKLIHLLVDHLLQRAYGLREEMDELEDECLADVRTANLGLLLTMRKEFSVLARYARTNAVAIDKLRNNPGYRDSVRLADAHEHMLRSSVIAESRAEHALSVMQVVQSLLSQQLNEVLTFLAVITVILTPLGVIAGIFGMNFVDMGVLKYPNGFALTIAAMLLLSAVLAVVFKIKKWW
ncbi:MAG: CorA family divalent cation transporter [Gallionella sp.]